jgi:DNA-binding transcriptional MerR regulator
MAKNFSIETLAQTVNEWCDTHQIAPASGQSGETLTERNIRYYRTLALLDPPTTGGGNGYGEKHCLQLKAIRLLQAQGLPLGRIRDLLFGRTLNELQQLEKQGLAELNSSSNPVFRSAAPGEKWSVMPLDEEFMLISRRGHGVSAEMRERLRAVLHSDMPVKQR